MERRYRLRRDFDIRRARARGRCWPATGMVVCILRAGDGGPRFAFVVGKRIGGAVVRNRVKRRLRAAARHLAPSLPPGYDIVVIARGPIVTRTSTEMGEALAGVMRRAGLQRPPAPPGTIATAEPAGPPTGPSA